MEAKNPRLFPGASAEQDHSDVLDSDNLPTTPKHHILSRINALFADWNFDSSCHEQSDKGQRCSAAVPTRCITSPRVAVFFFKSFGRRQANLPLYFIPTGRRLGVAALMAPHHLPASHPNRYWQTSSSTSFRQFSGARSGADFFHSAAFFFKIFGRRQARAGSSSSSTTAHIPEAPRSGADCADTTYCVPTSGIKSSANQTLNLIPTSSEAPPSGTNSAQPTDFLAAGRQNPPSSPF
ncbi:hypothetical protein B0H15DRAFT_799295 [Mycena belliarum]|uniref:Uncharacterized protein n=1 Tax=Mycena belliarum TaxID=1033014 RepID=A0AAD6UC85_9AGAR|nr:hypothetical protein B0H15DRAFT_799295 [Mycena belliae]